MNETELTIPFGNCGHPGIFFLGCLSWNSFALYWVQGPPSPMGGVLGGIEACIPALRRYARTLLGDPQEADDLVHHCLVRALERLPTRRESANLRVWLFAMMHDLYVSRSRRGKALVAARQIAENKGRSTAP